MIEFDCSVVFVSRIPDLHRAIFDERLIFDSIDTNQSMMIGPTGTFFYNSGNEKFSIQPDKLTLTQRSPEIFNQRLVDAANQIASTIHNHYRPHSISGIGINLDVPFIKESFEVNALDFCKKLADPDNISKFLNEKVSFAYPRWLVERDGLRYDISIHPDFHPDRANLLLLRVNAHQDVAADEHLNQKLANIPIVSKYFNGLYDQLQQRMRESI